jgi:hypothetical protein
MNAAACILALLLSCSGHLAPGQPPAAGAGSAPRGVPGKGSPSGIDALGLTTFPTALTMLSIVHAGIAFADTWSTQRVFEQHPCQSSPHAPLAGDVGGPCKTERNVLTRPFQSHGKALAYASTYAGLRASELLAERMRRSHNWTRHIWWLPQAALVGGSIYGVQVNLGVRAVPGRR